MTIVPYSVIFAAGAFEVLGQVCLKLGAASRAIPADSIGDFWISVARSRWTYAGIFAYAVEILLWIAALRLAPLSQAFPLMALSYCGVALASRVFLGERISLLNGVGIALITLGAACLIGASA